jgi:hypothetical protein
MASGFVHARKTFSRGAVTIDETVWKWRSVWWSGDHVAPAQILGESIELLLPKGIGYLNPVASTAQGVGAEGGTHGRICAVR